MRAKNRSLRRSLDRFWLALAVCHTVLVADVNANGAHRSDNDDEDNDEQQAVRSKPCKYQATSPDEAALVEAGRKKKQETFIFCFVVLKNHFKKC